MDFNKLLNIAKSNKAVAQSEASIKRCNTSLAPAKKESKSNVPSVAVQAFLARKEKEKRQKEIEEQKKKDQLLELRSQNVKNNKAAKLMASRTKDNDFSRIKLTEDDIEEKKKREAEIMRLELNNKRDRMRARIDLEDKEKLLPHKRKRKSKNLATDEVEDVVSNVGGANGKCSYGSSTADGKKKLQLKPSPSNLSFNELLRVAQVKQFEPVPVKKVIEKEERPLTMKAKRLLMEEENRTRRKLALQNNVKLSEDGTVLNPLPLQPEVPAMKKMQQSFKRKNTPNPIQSTKNVLSQQRSSNQTSSVHGVKGERQEQICKGNQKFPTNSNSKPSQTTKIAQSFVKGKNGNVRPDKDQLQLVQRTKAKSAECITERTLPSKQPKLDLTEDLIAQIEERVRMRLEKEFEEKYRSANLNGNSALPEIPNAKPIPKDIVQEKKMNLVLHKSVPPTVLKTCKVEKDPVNAKPVKTKKDNFHINPYMQPVRRLLEKTNSCRQLDDDEDVDDDDENYSKHIKKMFKYDRSKFQDDDDDDDIIESNFAMVEKEERKSAILGYKEDLEDIAKEKQLKRLAKGKKTSKKS